MKRMGLAGLWLVGSVSLAIAHPVGDGAGSGVPDMLLNGAYDYSGYEAEVVEVIDAATIRVNIHMWPGRILTTEVVAPDIETPDSGVHQCAQQTEFADAALSSVRRSFPAGAWVYVNDVAFDGERVVADVVRWQDGAFTSVADILLSRPGRWGVTLDDAPFDWCFGQE